MTGLLIYFKLAFIIGSIFSLAIWWLLFVKNRSSLQNRIFGTASLMTFIWSIGFFGLTTADTLTSAYIWRWFMESGSIFIPAIWYHFIFTHLQLTEKHVKGIRLMYVVSAIIWMLNFADLFLPGIFASSMGPKLFFPYYPSAGVGYYLFFIHFAVSSIYTVFYLHKYLNRKSGVQKEQIRFILLAAYFGFGGGGTTFLLTFGFNVVPFGIFFFAFYPIIIAYAIVKYRLMNIRRVVTKSILYFLLVSVITTVFAFTSLFVGEQLAESGRIGRIVVFMIVSFIVVVGLDPLKRLLSKVTDDIFYKDKVDYQRVLRQLGIIISKEIELEVFIDALRSGLLHDLKVKAADILIPHGTKYASLSRTTGKFFSSDGRLAKHLRSHKDIIITDELYRLTSDMTAGSRREHYQSVLEELERQGVELCVPVMHEGSLKAIIILGQKQAGDIYSNEDIAFFRILSPQIAVAIKKAELYQEIREFNLGLQDKVNQATMRLKVTNQELEEANTHLTQLDKAKSEFLSIASHQLRTPISAVKGYLSMLLEGDYGDVPENQRKVISDLFESASRLARLINIFLNVSRIESGKFKLDRKEVNLNELVTSVTHELDGQAQSKGLKVTFKPQHEKVTSFIDSDKIREVILNLVDNAIKYTKSGVIEISSYVEDEQYHFLIKDKGIGIRTDEVKSLFRKFVRGTGIAQINTQGSGLGLYIAQRVVAEHGGKIWAESDGLSKGSTFHFHIPLVKASDFTESVK